MLLAAGSGLVAVAFVLCYVLCWAARRWAPAAGLVDRPGGRKAHRQVTPLGGGVAIWLTCGMVLAAGAVVAQGWRGALPYELGQHVGGLKQRAWEMVGIFGLASCVMLMGLVDDRWGLGWKPRLLVQFALATTFVVCWGRVTLFLPHSPTMKVVTGAVTVVWIVGLTNSFNFLDNMDGLAASVGLIAAALFAAGQAMVGSLFVPAVLLVLVGALAGFLVHNHHPARLFMGDAGSNFLGFLLGTLTVAGTFTRPGFSSLGVLTPLLVMAVPLYDTASVILIRIREGRSPFQADRSHFSHRLVDRGLTPVRAVWTIDLVTLISGLGALLLHRLDPFEGGVVVAQTACVLALVAVLEVSTTRPERRDGEAKPPTGSTPAAGGGHGDGP
jgi:UDP-GlcNAc:undecaprenyl-phosphate/decaprenyl-phosphate GlcNAc-1-phosphate transferase